MKALVRVFLLMLSLSVSGMVQAQPGFGRGFREDSTNMVKLGTIRLRDGRILPEQASKTCCTVGPGARSVRVYTSEDLVGWQKPQTIFRPPADIWGDIPVGGIWAPEMHADYGRYYLFLTFDTRHQLPEQWRNWRPRVMRASTIPAPASPMGPFTTFTNHSTPPAGMMTLDGTLRVEAGVPHRVFSHQWVQITRGSLS